MTTRMHKIEAQRAEVRVLRERRERATQALENARIKAIAVQDEVAACAAAAQAAMRDAVAAERVLDGLLAGVEAGE